MAEAEKPLHVQVAEAFGWTDFQLVPAPHNVGQIAEDGAFPSLGERMVWAGLPPVTVHDPEHPEHRQKACAYAYEDEACECTPRTKLNKIRPPACDTDWAVGGPFIEAFHLWVQPCADHAKDHGKECRGWLCVSENIEEEGGGATPLQAVCMCILRLKAAGKLEAA